MSERFKSLFTILVVMVVLLTCLPANADNEKWDCPECGRTGNTGNYCGGCAHPAPWLDTPKPTDTPKPMDTPVPSISALTATTETTEELLKIRVNWIGGTAPYHVYLYPYINESHQYSGVHVAYLDQKSVLYGSGKTEVYFDKYLSPNQAYWIKVVDSSKQETWLKYTFPQIPYEGFKVKIDYVFFETRTYGESGYTGRIISKNKLAMTKKNKEKIDDGDISTLIRLSGNFSDLFPDGYFKYNVWGCTIIHPNGIVTVVEVDNSRWTKDNQKYAEWDLNAAPDNHILLQKLSIDYNGASNIPLGKYTVILTYGNYYVGSTEFTFAEK